MEGRRTYHFQKETLSDIHIRRQRGLDQFDVDGNNDAHHSRRANRSQQLRRQENQTAERRQVPRQNQPKRDSPIKQPSTNAIQYQSSHQQAEAVPERDEDDGLVGVSAAGRGLGREAHAHGVDQVAGEEEEEGADEFAGGGDEVLVRGGPVVLGVGADVPEHGLVQDVGHVGGVGRRVDRLTKGCAGGSWGRAKSWRRAVLGESSPVARAVLLRKRKAGRHREEMRKAVRKECEMKETMGGLYQNRTLNINDDAPNGRHERRE